MASVFHIYFTARAAATPFRFTSLVFSASSAIGVIYDFRMIDDLVQSA
jgi:hypothetical protein